MYTSFFGLNEKPFSITPDPRYLYLSERHAEALAHLLYGVTESGGFVQLTGEVGTGKTTVVRSLLEQLPGGTDVALVLNPNLSPREFLLTICEELGVALNLQERHSLKAIVDALNRRLLDAHAVGRRVVLIVDEAQNLSPELLEQIRLLTNLETAKRKLLQIILIGQPELRELLERNDLRQLAQRITGRYHLEPLDQEETRAYIGHRLQVAGGHAEVFTKTATAAVYRSAGGVPRLINVISDRALLGAYSLEQQRVSGRLARRAAYEVAGGRRHSRLGRWFARVFGAVLAVAVVGAIAVVLRQGETLPRKPVVGEASRLSEDAAFGTGATDTMAMAEPAGAAAIPSGDTDALPGPEVLLATTEAPPAVAPRPPALEERLAGLTAMTDTDTAFATLLSLWGVDYAPAVQRPCEAAESRGLRCLYERGSWRGLVNLDRPAILSLALPGNRDHSVVLAGLTPDGSARLLIGNRRESVALSELMSMWTGEYLLIWRPESGPGRTLTQGAFGPDVLWLRRSLATVLDTSLQAPQPDRYDAVLADAVRRFQIEARLEPDGIAGARTMISLNSALDLPARNRLEREG